MNVLTDTWRGLVQRRLWPVALLLLAAAAAVPFLLAKSEDPVLPNQPIAAAATETDDVSTAPIVAVASSAQREVGRDVVGSRKDPFRPAVAARKAPKPKTTTSTDTGSAQPAGDDSSSGSTGGGTTVTPVAPTPVGGVGIEPRKEYEVATIAVRFGDSATGARPLTNLRRLKALPSVAEPVLIYLGLRKDSKTAVFMVDGASVLQGDGKCLPSPQNCQTIELQPGETEFIDVEVNGSVSQYQLDFVKVRRKRVTSEAAAARAYRAEAAGGRMVLRERFNLMGRWRYDKETGKLRRIGKKAHAAGVARYVARAAAAAAASAAASAE